MGHTKEIWDAKGYNSANGAQIRDAKETIDIILKDGCKKAGIIVDIGCGSGNVTKMLSTLVPHDKIYALDFDHTMIEHANSNYNDGTIEYFQQNIDLPWEMLDERLKYLEGKVDIVWSNRVLHWVNDKQRVAKTIGRLLKRGGRCFINITLTRNLTQFATEEQKREILKCMHVESEKEQMEYWTKYFTNCGLSSDVSVQLIPKEWKYDSVEQFEIMEAAAAILQLKRNEDFENNPHHNRRNTYYEQCRIVGTK